MTTGRRRIRQPKTPPTFEFEYQGKKYIIHGRYECQPATLFLTDGAVLHVRVWKISTPYEPQPYQVESFDPASQSAAELAAATESGFVAELQDREDGNGSTKAQAPE